MKGSKPFPVLLLGLCMLLLTACGSSHPPNGPGALTITNTSVPGGVVQSPYSVTFGTTGGQAPFTWTLNSGTLPPGLTLSSGGVISGTPLNSDLNSDGTAKTYNFTVKVTDSQTPTAAYQTGAFSIIINPLPIVTSTTLPNATLGVAYITVLTNSGGLAPFSWSITAGSLPPGLTLSASAASISGTPTGLAQTYPFTIQVTDADSNTATAQVSITVAGELQGTFAFSFNGFNNGNPFYTVGSFTGDGAGNINSGVLDQTDFVNGVATVSNSVPFTGTYTVGSDNLGTITLIIGAPLNVTYSYTFAVPLQGDLNFILADTNHPQVYGSGAIKTQTLSKLSLITLAGNYALGFFGVDPGGNRSAGAGYFNADTSGNLTSGIEDTNDNGTASQAMFMGTAPWTFDPTTGRGVVALTVGANTLHYAVYVVNPSTGLVAVQIDPGSSSVSLASWLKQLPGSIGNGFFSNTSLNANSVMELSGVSSSGGTPAPDVSLGTSTFDSMGHITFFQIDENNGGTATENVYTTGTYSVDSTTGRVTVAGLGSGPQPVWYLVNANAGFVIGADSSVTEGSFELQSSGFTPPSFTLPSFLVSYAGGTVQPVLPTVTNEADSTLISPPGGTIVVTYDTSGSSGPVLTNPTVAFTYGLGDIVPNSNPPDNTTGKFLLTPAMPAGGTPFPTPSNFCKCNQIVYMVTAVTIPMTGSRDLTTQKWVSINLAIPSTGAADPNPRLTYVRSTFGTF
ncbi:MAG: Ig domain-containing protein [Candidatus Korobacteraceae bacterium]